MGRGHLEPAVGGQNVPAASPPGTGAGASPGAGRSLSAAEQRAKRRLTEALGARLSEMAALLAPEQSGVATREPIVTPFVTLLRSAMAQPSAVVDSVYDEFDVGSVTLAEHARRALRDALVVVTARVLEHFRAIDGGGDGGIEHAAFHRGVMELGFDAPAGAVDALFSELDDRRCGRIALKALQAMPHRRAAGGSLRQRRPRTVERRRRHDARARRQTAAIRPPAGGWRTDPLYAQLLIAAARAHGDAAAPSDLTAHGGAVPARAPDAAGIDGEWLRRQQRSAATARAVATAAPVVHTAVASPACRGGAAARRLAHAQRAGPGRYEAGEAEAFGRSGMRAADAARSSWWAAALEPAARQQRRRRDPRRARRV